MLKPLETITPILFALALAPPAVASEGPWVTRSWEFNQNQNREGWTFSGLQEQGGPSGGTWLFTVPGQDPQLWSPDLVLPADLYETIEIRLANDGNPAPGSTLEVFWIRDGDASVSPSRRVAAQYSAQGDWVTVTLDPTSNPEWSGTIRKLRIDPVLYGDGHWIGIDSIAVKGTSMALWLSPMPFTAGYALRPDYVSQVRQPLANWPSSFARANTFKFFVDTISLASDAELDSMVQGLQRGRHRLAAAFEVAGAQHWPDCGPVFNAGTGECAFALEAPKLDRWVAHGGTVDYITSDHSIMYDWPWRPPCDPGPGCIAPRADYPQGRGSNDLALVIDELLDYFALAKARYPGVKVGLIESLGFFYVHGRDRDYAKAGGDGHIWFSEAGPNPGFLERLLAAAAAKGVTIDHFDVDHSFFGAAYDTDPTAPVLDYGRIRAVEDACQARGLKVGILFNDPGAGWEDPATPADTLDRTAVERTVRYVTEYLKEGNPDRAIVQTWFANPRVTGPEQPTSALVQDTKFFQMARQIANVLPGSLAYEFSVGREGWSTVNMTEQQSPTQFDWAHNGGWLFTVGPDPQMLSPRLSLDTSRYKKVVVRLANANGPAADSVLDLYWKKELEENFLLSRVQSASVPSNGAWVEVTLDMTGHPDWTGTVTQLRVDPVRRGGSPATWLGIDYIRVVSEYAAPRRTSTRLLDHGRSVAAGQTGTDLAGAAEGGEAMAHAIWTSRSGTSR